MKHKKYNRIEGLWHQKTVQYYRNNGWTDKKIDWCVTEKVHGSNFAFYVNQNEMQFAKRSQILADGENFFQCDRMIKEQGWQIEQLYGAIGKSFNIEEIIVYGELFGGYYPHKEVNNLMHIRRIQKGVWYHPDIRFYAFDLWIKTSNFEGFMNYSLATQYFKEVGLFYAKILKRGTFDDCIKYSDEFQTTIPEGLGLPLIEDNICEGIVIKPISAIHDESGDRVILKSKNAKFKEVSGERGAAKIRKAKGQLSEFAIKVVDLIDVYINENRLRNVLSKFGEFKRSDFNVIYLLFKEDVLEEFNRHHLHIQELDETDKKGVQKAVGSRCVAIWRPIFLTESLP